MNTMLVSPTHGDIVFDAVFKTNHNVELEVTQHPVQYGASITDHSYFNPELLDFEFGYSDVMGQMGEVNHSVNAYTLLREIMAEREPLTVVTRLKQYEDMLITRLSVPDEVGQMYGLKGEIRLQQVMIVEAAIVKVQTKITSSKSGGKTASNTATSTEESLTEVDNRSYLRILGDQLGINLNIPGRDGKATTVSQGSTSSSGSKTIKKVS